jgi:hypothetical protein
VHLQRRTNSMRPNSPTVQLAELGNKSHNRKEVKTMKYETPELTALTPAINAIQSGAKQTGGSESPDNDGQAAYEDWE